MTPPPSDPTDQKPTDSKPTDSQPDATDSEEKPTRRFGSPPGWLLLALLLTSILLLSQSMGEKQSDITYSFFDKQVQAGNVRSIEIRGLKAHGEFRVPPLASELEAEINPPEEEPKKTDFKEKAKEAPIKEDKPKEDKPKEDKTKETQPKEDKPKENKESKEKKSDEEEPARLQKQFVVTLLHPYPDDELFRFWRANGVDSINPNPPTDYSNLLYGIWLVILLAMMIGMWTFVRRSRDQMMGGGMLGGVSRSPARRYDGDDENKITFDEVAGLEGVKRDLKEVVDFLKDPEKFQRLGARVPKGVLLMGPPGTGKTLLARAVAGEAGVPFFSINGSEFIQLFVGVGASRVRDLFKTAKEASPAILFIDEIDAIGRQRGAGLGGGHDEREQTLNQILSEMDGFTTTTSVILIAATNRPDVLDPALLRPGRFDRHVMVDRPSVDARKQLFEVHTRSMPIAEDVEFDRLARATVGLTGADIQNLANEAALWATRHEKEVIAMDDFEHARDKVLMGARRDEVLTDEEKRITAYHEAGHTLLAWHSPGCDSVHKVTIIPRGRALGVTQLVPEEDRHNMSEHQMHAMLAMMLGGRTAEKITFDEYSAGAENDLMRATDIARKMVTLWGMSERLGPVAYQKSEDNPFLGREMAHDHRMHSEHTAQIIDEEVAKILHTAADRAKRTLNDYSEQLIKLSEELITREVLDQDDIAELIGPSVHKPTTDKSAK